MDIDDKTVNLEIPLTLSYKELLAISAAVDPKTIQWDTDMVEEKLKEVAQKAIKRAVKEYEKELVEIDLGKFPLTLGVRHGIALDTSPDLYKIEPYPAPLELCIKWIKSWMLSFEDYLLDRLDDYRRSGEKPTEIQKHFDFMHPNYVEPKEPKNATKKRHSN